jgi:hypothetical protein
MHAVHHKRRFFFGNGIMDRCKYCRKELSDGGCKTASDANRCGNSHPDVIYRDREQPTTRRGV